MVESDITYEQKQALQSELKKVIQTLFQQYGEFRDPFSVDPNTFEIIEGSNGTSENQELILAVQAQNTPEFLIGVRAGFKNENTAPSTTIDFRALDITRTDLAKAPKHRETVAEQFFELALFGIKGEHPITPLKSPDELGLSTARFKSGRPGFQFSQFEFESNALELLDKYRAFESKMKAITSPEAKIDVLFKDQSGKIPLTLRPF